MGQRLDLMFLDIGCRAARRLLRNSLDNDRKIVPKTKRNKQFRHHKHRPEQQVRWVIHQCRLSLFENPVSDNLKSSRR